VVHGVTGIPPSHTRQLEAGAAGALTLDAKLDDMFAADVGIEPSAAAAPKEPIMLVLTAGLPALSISTPGA
jgi:hypothetical protein